MKKLISMHKKLFQISIRVVTSLGLISQVGQCMDNDDKPSMVEKIPAEKMVQIFEYLPKKDLKCLPLVCWDFYQIIYGFNIGNMATIFTAPYGAQNADLIDLSQTFLKISELHLGNNYNITSTIMSHLPNLHTLYIDANHIQREAPGTEEDFLSQPQTPLCSSFCDDNIELLGNLTKLNLGDFTRTITDAGITKLTNLTQLTVGHSNRYITNHGISQMTHLIKLTLNCNNYDSIDENGITYLTNLQELSIPTNIKKINTFAGFVHMTNLTQLHLSNRDDINKPEYWLLRGSNSALKINWTYNNNSNPTWR